MRTQNVPTDLAMDIDLLSCENITAKLSPIAEGEHSDVIIGLEDVVRDDMNVRRRRRHTSMPSFLNLP